MSTKGKKDNN